MKKIICLIMIFVQLFFISGYTAVKDKETITPKINFEPKNKVKPTAEKETEPIAEKKVKPRPEKKAKPEAEKQAIEVQETKEEVATTKKRTIFSRLKFSEQQPLRKIARGAVNTTLGWLEIPHQTIKVNKEKGDIAGAFWGPLKGFAFFVGRTAIGIYEVTTFLLPPYKTVVEPEFIFADEEDD